MNLLFLALIVFVPFPTSVMSDYGSTRTATIFYAASLAAIGLVLCFIILYATRGNRLVADAVLLDPHIRQRRDNREGPEEESPLLARPGQKSANTNG